MTSRTQPSKRLLRLASRFARTVSLLGTFAPPAKLPQLSNTDASRVSIPGGDTMCNHTRPRSAAIDFMRSPYGGVSRGSLHRLRGHTAVASSDTFIRCVSPSSVKRLWGWSEAIGSSPLAG